VEGKKAYTESPDRRQQFRTSRDPRNGFRVQRVHREEKSSPQGTPLTHQAPAQGPDKQAGKSVKGDIAHKKRRRPGAK
jgi:hypothetical protein